MQLETRPPGSEAATVGEPVKSLMGVVHKPRSLGCSWKTLVEPEEKARHLLLYLPEFPCGQRRKRYDAMLVGQVSRVLHFKGAAGKVEEADYIGIVHKRLTNIVDLSATIYAIRVGQKCDGNGIVEARRQVTQFASRATPDRMELCFDKNTWHLPDRPAVQLFSALSSNVFWHDGEAFKRWLTDERPVRDT
ncbi:hypothetical protein [Paraburkholderia heleia]|uniref:hypothetical protein n=1 Tax=Paraburkholderia heleia TaxID=634127 RepID=UPI0031D4B6D5